jgi:hypothetical protein
MAANVYVDWVLLGGTKTLVSRNLNVPVLYISSNSFSTNTTNSTANVVSPTSWTNNTSQGYGHAIVTVSGGPVRMTWNNTASNSTYGIVVLANNSVAVEIGANTKIHATEIAL